jgi:hypothetical protein
MMVDPTSGKTLEEADPTHLALRLHHVQNVMADAREHLLEQIVFSRVTDSIAARKGFHTYRRLLRSESAARILAILWRESPYVSDRDISSLGLSRSFPDMEITQHGLAAALATEPEEVSALHSQVRHLRMAAEAYGLVRSRVCSPARIYIQGTELLHQFMVRLAEESAAAIEQPGKAWKPRLKGSFDDHGELATDDGSADPSATVEPDWTSEAAAGIEALNSGVDDLLAVARRAARIANKRSDEIDGMLAKIQAVRADAAAA